MKDKVIEAAGKTWQFLGTNGETDVKSLSKGVKEKEEVVYQALGWLAREDKVDYSTKGSKIFVSLIQSELDTFRQTFGETQKKETKKETSPVVRQKAKQPRVKRRAAKTRM